MTEKDILSLINKDEWMMIVLKTAQSLDLPDWMVGAGFVRNKVWDHLHGFNERTPLSDIDVIYFDSQNINETREKELEQALKEKMSGTPWSVKNQARMHLVNNEAPYISSEDALSRWPEVVTCVAVKLNDNQELELIAPHGISELVNLEVKPSPAFMRKLGIYEDRIRKKGWQEKWPKLKIHHS